MKFAEKSCGTIKVRKRTAQSCQRKTGSARFGEADVSECKDFARGINVLVHPV